MSEQLNSNKTEVEPVLHSSLEPHKPFTQKNKSHNLLR